MNLARRHHQLIRFASLIVAGCSLTYMATRSPARRDVTEEGLSRVTPATIEVIQGVSAERPVTVHAFVSNEVPREYVTVRTRLLNILREMEARGGDGLTVRIVEPDSHSLESEEALENYGIGSVQLADRSSGRVRAMDVFLGLAFVSGPRTQVIPFFDRGMSIEYEVNRALRVVLQEERKVVGILRTDATIMGNFDMHTRRREPPWQIIEELRKQYEVRSLNASAPIPEDVHVLIVPQLASCTQEELNTVRDYINAGRAALLTVDPVPLFNSSLAPSQPKPSPDGQQGGMFGGGGAPPEAKGDYKGLLRTIGVQWDDERIVYDTINPNPMLDHLPQEIVFASAESGSDSVESDDPAIKDLSEVVLMFAGEISAASGAEDHFKPLLQTSTRSGYKTFGDLYETSMFGGIMPKRQPGEGSPVTGRRNTLAARINTMTEPGDGQTPVERNVVVLADLDLFGDQFFMLAARGGDLDGDGLDDAQFDNVPFLLNTIDDLAGDERFLELRRRRPTFRRLTTVDELTTKSRAERQVMLEEANARADAELAKAKTNLESAVELIRDRTDLDETTKDVSLAGVEAAENRRLQARTAEIEREKEREIEKIDNRHSRAIDEIQNQLRLLAVLIPPMPALLLGVFIFARKRRRERDAIPTRRRHSAQSKSNAKSSGGAT